MLKYFLPSLLLITLIYPLHATTAQPNTQQVVKNSDSGGALTESKKIQMLISHIRSMNGAIFIRNGSEYSCKEAADHLEAKWQKHGSRIKDANDFIKHLASKSSMSGNSYLIRYPNGKTYTTSAVLHRELQQIERRRKL